MVAGDVPLQNYLASTSDSVAYEAGRVINAKATRHLSTENVLMCSNRFKMRPNQSCDRFWKGWRSTVARGISLFFGSEIS